jgi:membrane-bound ClpP family serine protease
VGYIKIEGQSGINQGTWLYVYKALERYKEIKPAFIIVELNTPGGEVFAAQKISNALKEFDTQFDIPVVAFINNWAISAGAMIAYSSRFITIVKDASMGAAEPLQLTAGTEAQTASEKVNSAIRTDFANRASFFDRNPNIAEAMVDKDVILVKRAGNVIKVSDEDKIETTDEVISPKGKLLTLSAKEMMELGVADILLNPAKLSPITEKETTEGHWPFDKTLLSTYAFFKEIPNAEVDAYTMDLKTRFFQFLMKPMVSSILFLGLMLGAYMELSTPGFGFPGSIAVVCLFLIILSSFALEIGGWLELILLGAGLTLFLIDLFFIPTFGLLGIAGIIAFIVGLVGLMVPGLEDFNFSFDTGSFNEVGLQVLERLAWLSGTLVVGLIIIAFLAKYAMPAFKPFQRLVSYGEQEGFTAGEAFDTLPSIGATGKVIAPLRPSGKIFIDNQTLDANSLGSFIEKGEEVIVERIEGSRIFVRKK